MIATDGGLDAKKTSHIAATLTGGDGHVTVLTVVEVPRQMLNDMRRAATESSGARTEIYPQYRHTQADDGPVVHWAGDDATVSRYVDSVVAARTADLVAELDAAGVDNTVVGVEGESAARSVLESVATLAPDVLCIGTNGLGRFEGMLGSLSTKVARLAPCSVLLVR
jgi:nucleotide-binding universal stress UspA family protein